MTKISVITPTYAREHFHASLLDCVVSQTHKNFEWLVLDDSPTPSAFLQNSTFPKLRYFHAPERRSVGAKRNWLAERADGEIIVHFDDDDYYAPDYLAKALAELEQRGLDFLNLRSWFLLDVRNDFFGYWTLNAKRGMHFRCSAGGITMMRLNGTELEGNELGWGFGFCYRRNVWDRVKFPDVDWDEDGAFSRAAKDHFRHGGWLDESGLCLHIIHGGNTSTCYAQFNLPLFAVTRIFPDFRQSGYVDAVRGKTPDAN